MQIMDMKNEINKVINSGLQEIFKPGASINENNKKYYLADIHGLLRALQARNKLNDFGYNIEWNPFLNKYEGKIIYNLIESEEDIYHETIDFTI